MWVCCVALPFASSKAEPSLRRVSVVVFPPATDLGAHTSLSIGVADQASERLYNTGQTTHFHIKQVLSYTRSIGVPSHSINRSTLVQSLLHGLGADYGVWGELRHQAKGWGFKVHVSQRKTNSDTVFNYQLPSNWARALDEGSLAMARSFLKIKGSSALDGHTKALTHSDDAAKSYLQCFEIIIRQPMGLRRSHTLKPQVIGEARQACQDSVKSDPALAQAWSALALAEALSFNHDAAAKALRQADALGGYMPLRTLARYWLKTRFTGNQQGEAVLTKAQTMNPSSLIFLTFLGHHLNTVSKHKAALGIWSQYTRFVRSGYGLTREGYARAKLGQYERAIALTREAFGLEPESAHIQLELASRLLDAKQLAEAEKLLNRLATRDNVSAEVLCRLGYVYLLQNKNELAHKWLKASLGKAIGTDEWRTRGRAHYDLAIVHARQGEDAKAELALLAADKEGYKIANRVWSHPDLERLGASKNIKKILGSKSKQSSPVLLFASPFPTNYLGEPTPNARRQPANALGF
jgi:tetratricopeptide (TPR) repeat protein